MRRLRLPPAPRNRGSSDHALAARGAAGLQAVNAVGALPDRIPSTVAVGGIGSEVIARVCEAVGDLKALPRRIGLPDIPCPASHYLEKFYHPSTEDIVKTAIQMF